MGEQVLCVVCSWNLYTKEELIDSQHVLCKEVCYTISADTVLLINHLKSGLEFRRIGPVSPSKWEVPCNIKPELEVHTHQVLTAAREWTAQGGA